MTFSVSIIRMAAIGFLISLAAHACSQPSRSLTVVTGKVTYGTLAMEGAVLKIYRMENGSSFAEAMEDKNWKVVEESYSGYHGSFRLHLAEGTYRIEARTTMRSGDNLITLAGALDPLIVDGKRRRMDQMVIELGKE
jgi:hypothetical protein